MPFDPQLFDERVFSAESDMSFTCLFDSAIFDGAVFDACVDAPDAAPKIINVGAGVDAKSWQEAVQEKFDLLNPQLQEAVKEQKKVARKIAAVKKKIQSAKAPEGILVNLQQLESRQREIKHEVKELRLQIEWVNIQIEEEDDAEEILLLH
jgi:hypothetical protein